MTDKEKSLAYDEALKRAKAAIDIAADKDLVKGVATTIFPELRESEDERIRKEIVGVIQKHYPNTPESYRWISWLVKQKESLHIPESCKENANSFTDARKDVIVAIEIYLDWLTGYPDYAPKGKYSIRDMLHCLFILEKQKEQKPLLTEETELNSIAFLEQLGYTCVPPGGEQKPAEWSEEDEEILNTIIADVSRTLNSCGIGTDEWNIRSKAIRFLKSLRPSWKPSEEQMIALDGCLEHWSGNKSQKEILESLYEQLKTLM